MGRWRKKVTDSIWWGIVCLPLGLGMIMGAIFFFNNYFDREEITEAYIYIENELKEWRKLTAPFDKILEEHKYFQKHGKFPDPDPRFKRDETGQKVRDTSILFTDKCPKPLKTTSEARYRPLRQFDEALEQYRTELVRASYVPPSLNAKFYVRDHPDMNAVALICEEEGRVFTKIVIRDEILDSCEVRK